MNNRLLAWNVRFMVNDWGGTEEARQQDNREINKIEKDGREVNI